MIYRRSLLVSALVGLCWFAGCGGPKGPVCAPVKGTAKFKGQPLAEAMIVLHPVGGDIEGNQKPMATTDANGNFTLTTFSQNDGAPPGDYAITVVLRAPQMAGEEIVRNGPNLLPQRFAKPESSGLKFAVAEGDNQIPPIEIPER